MTIGNSSTAGSVFEGVVTTRSDELRAYDALPPALRMVLREGVVQFSAIAVLHDWRSRQTRRHYALTAEQAELEILLEIWREGHTEAMDDDAGKWHQIHVALLHALPPQVASVLGDIYPPQSVVGPDNF